VDACLGRELMAMWESMYYVLSIFHDADNIRTARAYTPPQALSEATRGLVGAPYVSYENLVSRLQTLKPLGKAAEA
jgi:hypothetical protein